MKAAAWALLASLALAGTVLSGCVSDDGDLSFGSVEAPVWEAGYEWTYAIDSTAKYTFKEGNNQATNTAEMQAESTLRVFNTTALVDGVPVYWTHAPDQEADMDDFFFGDMGIMGMFGHGEASAVRRSDLTQVAAAWSWGGEDCYYSEAYPVEDAPEPLAFPLKNGKTWGGDNYDMRVSAKVMGIETITVPAGSFQAVRIHHVIESIAPSERAEPIAYDVAYEEPVAYDEEYGPEREEFRAEQDVWYSPEARHIVKIAQKMTGEFAEGDESASISGSSVVELLSYSLEAGAEQPAPFVRSYDEPDYPREMLKVVSDTSFPVNIANGSVTARFTLASREIPVPTPLSPDADGHDHDRVVIDDYYETGAPAVMDPFVPYEAPEGVEVIWWVSTSSGHEQPQQFTGEVFELDLTDGGRYYVRAELRPEPRETSDDCGGLVMVTPAMVYWGLEAYADAYWEKIYEDIQVEPGLATSIPLDQVPVSEDGYARLFAAWSIESSVPYAATDDARPVLTGAGGDYAPGSPAQNPWEEYPLPGLYDLAWEASTVNHPYGGPLGPPVVVGHTATLKLRIDYM